jgi:hypothetical protein
MERRKRSIFFASHPIVRGSENLNEDAIWISHDRYPQKLNSVHSYPDAHRAVRFPF